MSMEVGTMEHGQLTILVTRYHECALVLLDYNLELLFPYTTQRYHGDYAVNFF